MYIKAVGFDWGGVIKGRIGSGFTMDACELISVDLESFRNAYFAHNKDVNRGDIDWPELWSRVLSDLNKTEFLGRVLELNAERDTNLPEQINYKMIDLVDSIRSRGYKTGLLSNNTLKAGKELRSLGIDKHFDELFAKELEVEMSELVFIDDAAKSLSTSAECGYTPILFESYDKLLPDLRALGVDF